MLRSKITNIKTKNMVKFYLNNNLIKKSINDPQETLLDFLRINQNLKGTKEGCAEGDCGACTILIGKLDKDNKVIYKTANSCILFLPSIDNSHLITIDGLSNSLENLHPIQEAFVKFSGAQCGFCTPGMVMSAVDLLQKNKKPSDTEIRDWLEGNICRCTGYQNIVAAVKEAATKM